jgi:hypothetical protein
MRPRLRLAYLEETADWEAAITAVTGRIAALYLYDDLIEKSGASW